MFGCRSGLLCLFAVLATGCGRNNANESIVASLSYVPANIVLLSDDSIVVWDTSGDDKRDLDRTGRTELLWVTAGRSKPEGRIPSDACGGFGRDSHRFIYQTGANASGWSIHLHDLTSGKDKCLASDGKILGLASPLCATCGGLLFERMRPHTLMSIDLATQEPRAVAPLGDMELLEAAFTADGKQVSYATIDQAGGIVSSRIDLASGASEVLWKTQVSVVDSESIRYSPDGVRMSYVRTAGIKKELVCSDLRGKKARSLVAIPAGDMSGADVWWRSDSRGLVALLDLSGAMLMYFDLAGGRSESVSLETDWRNVIPLGWQQGGECFAYGIVDPELERTAIRAWRCQSHR